jgi:C-terminal processing protease CtpA/Prc
LTLAVKDSLIDLRAEEVPLNDVLKAIAAKTELSIESDDALTERISCEFKEISLEKVIQQLLKDRNYAMVYRETENNRFLPSELWIVSGSNFQRTPIPTLPENPMKDYMKDYEKERFKKEFEDEEKLLNLISTGPSKGSPDGRGITITSVSEGSVFQKIGLKEGDLIYDVNGMSITTVQDFILVLKSVSSTAQPHLRIGLRREDNSTHPIYIQLH